MALGREQINWADSVWQALDDAVHDEFHRAAVGLKFIPFHDEADSTVTVSADVIDVASMTIDESDVIALMELSLEFALTRQQVAGEQGRGAAVTLATRAASLIAQAEDMVIFHGEDAFKDSHFTNVRHSGGGGLQGLVKAAASAVTAKPISQKPARYGINGFNAVAEAYGILQNQGHGGPYAVALHGDLYADSLAPVAEMAAVPADQIRQLAALGLFGTGTLPPKTGIVTSLGGNSLDLVVAVEPTTEFLQQDQRGLYRFRIFERFALRVKEKTAIVRLNFE